MSYLKDLYNNSYPENLGKCFMMEEHEGFGFQAAGGPSGFIVFATITKSTTSLPSDAFIQSKVQKDIKSTKPLYVKTFSTRTFIGTHWSEWELILQYIQWFLDNGYNVILNNCLKVAFYAGDTYSIEEEEKRFVISSKLGILSECKGDWKMWFCLTNLPHSVFEYWNWTTQCGKSFCEELRYNIYTNTTNKSIYNHITPMYVTNCRYMDSSYEEMCKKYKVLHRGGWSAYDPSFQCVEDKVVIQ